MRIIKSYCYYFKLFPSEERSFISFLNDSCFDYIFSCNKPNPEYIEQGICDILPNGNGILFTHQVLQQFKSNQIFNDFDSCFAFFLPTEICDREQSRYRKNYTFNFNIEELKKEVPIDLIFQYENSFWKPILEIDPDFFYLKDDKQILLGSKDFNQVENWIN